MSVFQIVYSSRNEIEGTPAEVNAEIASILQTARSNNARANVTGALLFNGVAFAQVLEGPPDAVEIIYEHIQCDTRHSDVILLSNTMCDQRAFSDWSMAYADPSILATQPDLKIDFDDAMTDRLRAGHRIVEMLQTLVAREGE